MMMIIIQPFALLEYFIYLFLLFFFCFFHLNKTGTIDSPEIILGVTLE